MTNSPASLAKKPFKHSLLVFSITTAQCSVSNANEILPSCSIRALDVIITIDFTSEWRKRTRQATMTTAVTAMNGFLMFAFVLHLSLAADKTPSGFPVITQSPTTRVIEIGHTAVMQCKATGTPLPKIYWIKDMKRVDMTNPRYSINSEGKFRLTNLNR